VNKDPIRGKICGSYQTKSIGLAPPSGYIQSRNIIIILSSPMVLRSNSIDAVPHLLVMIRLHVVNSIIVTRTGGY
jgi:hypothetical protein